MIDPETLETNPALRDLPIAARSSLAEHARAVEFREEERILPLFEPSRRLVLLESGFAKLSQSTWDGRERILAVLRRGDVVGARALLPRMPDVPRPIVAMSRVKGIEIDLVDLHAVGRRHPELLIAISQALLRRLDRLSDRMFAAMSEEIPVRLCGLFLDFVDEDQQDSDEFLRLDHRLTHETMAQIAGASRPHVSSVLADLEERGIVRRDHPELLVRPRRLRRTLSHEIDVHPARSSIVV